MAKQELARFCRDYLSRDSDLKASMDAIADQRQFARAMVGAGGKAGFAFTEDEVLEVLATPLDAIEELTEEQLESVAETKPTTKTQPKSKTQYLQFKLEEVFVTS